MNSNWVIGIFISAIFSACDSRHVEEHCNSNSRRAIKLLTDEAAKQLDTTARWTSIDSLGQVPTPSVAEKTPRLDLEFTCYRVRARVEKVVLEDDGDYHLLLTDGSRYLIAECPNPKCEFAKGSPFVETFARVRSFIEHQDLTGKTIVLSGPAFVDVNDHVKTKNAPNDIELHPILSIGF